MKIHNEKLQFKEKAQSKCGSMDNADHVAAGKFGFNVGIKNLERFSKFITLKIIGGNVKIHNEKLHFKEKAQSKCGSMDNADHVAAGKFGSNVGIKNLERFSKFITLNYRGQCENPQRKASFQGEGSVQVRLHG